jgi:hypothetical protein
VLRPKNLGSCGVQSVSVLGCVLERRCLAGRRNHGSDTQFVDPVEGTSRTAQESIKKVGSLIVIFPADYHLTRLIQRLRIPDG